MKTTHSLLILVALMCLMACSSQLHVVTLYVDTTQIDQSNIAQNASFGQPLGIANEDFITNVRKRDKIIWQGLSTSDKSHKVTISSIKHESGDFLLGQIPAISKRAKKMNYNKFIRKIIAKPGREQAYAEEKYSLKFEVSNKPELGPFEIDPKIRSH